MGWERLGAQQSELGTHQKAMNLINCLVDFNRKPLHKQLGTAHLQTPQLVHNTPNVPCALPPPLHHGQFSVHTFTGSNFKPLQMAHEYMQKASPTLL